MERAEKRETISSKTIQLVIDLIEGRILGESEGAAFVDVNGLDQAEISQGLGRSFHKVSLSEVLGNDGAARIPEERRNLVVTGYEGISSADEERKAQAAVRSSVTNPPVASRGDRPRLVVLSSRLPEPDIKNADKPWGNAPFSADSFWSIIPKEKHLECTRYITQGKIGPSGKISLSENEWGEIDALKIPVIEKS